MMKYVILLFTSVIIVSCSNEPRETPESRELGKQIEKSLAEQEAEKKEIAQESYVLSNETVVLEFKTKNKKRLTVCRDENNKYLVYRFGSEDKIELQYPEKPDETSFKKFDYSSYMRGGGIDNLGMDLNYLYFTNNGYRYVVYKTYAAESVGNENEVGVKIINLKTKKETDISGEFKSFKGGFPVEIMNLVNQSEELFD